MARRKKKEQLTKQTIAYQGNVKIQSVKGNKVYKEHTQHNAGTADLFRYIANCIIGNYNQSVMPRYVRLFDCKDPDQQLISEVTMPNIWSNPVSAINVPFSTVQVKADSSSSLTIEKPYVAEFTFMIPYTQIQDDFNVVCLYNVMNAGANVTPLAYIILRDSENKPIYYEIDNNNTSNIVITWEMKVCNQQVSL